MHLHHNALSSLGAPMKRVIFTSLTLSIVVLISSCASEKFFKALNIDYTPSQEKIAVEEKLRAKSATDQKTILDLKEQLAAAKEQEELLNQQIEKLEEEIIEKEKVISIQGKVIGLLDDAEKTLQKSIDEQIRSR